MLKPFSSQSRKILFILIAITVVSRLALAFRSDVLIASRTYIEDAFYAFNIADHIAHGDGITADGIRPTNGIQPLIVFLYVPFFAVANKWLAVRLIFILIAAIESASIVMLAKLLRRLSRCREGDVVWWQRPWIVGPVIWTFVYALLVHNGNGLETGLYALMLLNAMHVYAGIRVKEDERRIGQWVLLGVSLGVTVLARIDAVFLVGSIGLLELFRRGSRALIQMAVMGITAFVVSSPWWLYNYLQFGSFMPISGQSQALINVIPQNLPRAIAVIVDILSTFFYVPYNLLSSWTLAVWYILVLGTIGVLAIRNRVWKQLVERSEVRMLAPLGLMGVCVLIYYVFFFSAPHFIIRYFHPIRLLWVLISCLAVPLVATSLESFYCRRPKLFIGLLAPVALAIVAFNAHRYISNFTVTYTNELYHAGIWAAKHPDKRVAMYQSGTSTFVAPNVTNVDGKVNPDATKAYLTTGIGVYLAEQRFDYIVDEPRIVGELVDSVGRRGVHYRLVDSVGIIRVFERVDTLDKLS